MAMETDMLALNTLGRSLRIAAAAAIVAALTLSNALSAASLSIKDSPLFLNDNTAPLNMLVMGRDHRIYYEAYNDASDLDGDGTLDVQYKPDKIDYFGYFDSKKCYTYSGGVFVPSNTTANKQCSAKWSGDWLNYVTTSRVDALRKVLYGGLRSTDSTTDTVLQRSFTPQDAHSWGKEYESVAVSGYDLTKYTPLAMPAANRRHLFANTTLSSDTAETGNTNVAINGVGLPKLEVLTDRQNRIWEWVSKERPVAGLKIDNTKILGGGHDQDDVVPTAYVVRVKVCVTGLEETNCKTYGTSKKPTGLLQDYGETDAMMFGLVSGSYAKPHEGGVLRKAVASMKNELNLATGQFVYNLDPPGIINSIDRFRVTGFNGDSYACGWITDSADAAGNCSMWGNPTAEMMYEVLRYFAGKPAATSDYNAGSDPEEDSLGLKKAVWNSNTDPYTTQPRCSKPFETVISDVNPSFDSDSIPGSSFSGWAGNDPVSGFNASSLGDTIWNQEMGSSGRYFIGQSGGVKDFAPTPKTVSSFANIRGISPEAPTKEGSYYPASVAYYGLEHDLNTASGEQKLETFAVALASPLPQIKIPVAGGKFITIVPFAKSVGGCLGVNGTQGLYQPTNQIVDFYVDTITPTYGKFRVNFEDVEQGADHDMDAIAVYEYTLNGNGSVTVTVTSEYSAGCITQHMGYVISGTTQDGSYLEVHDVDTDGSGNDVDYFLDTPPNQPPGGNWNDGAALPLVATRNFLAGSSSGANFLKDPLWYAAKWGGFKDGNGDKYPNSQAEWDSDGDGDPDNYFLVTNALTLKDQLSKAFNDILNHAGSASSASVNSGSISSTTRIYQAKFASQYWSGQLLAFPITAAGVLGPISWDASQQIPVPGSREIFTVDTNLSSGLYRNAVPMQWTAIGATRQGQLQPTDALGQQRLAFLRGDRSNEKTTTGGIFRKRDGVLGDIVNSAPVFVGAPPFRYSDTLESAPYSTFRTNNAARQSMVYVGANDGMLHGFNAATGAEKFAFIPASVFRNLYRLSDPSYSHLYFVDGSPNVIDAFYAGAWHTVLAAGLNKGGKGVYALDVTNPASITEAGAASTFLWEFTNRTDRDMGYSYSRPAIVRLKNGKWAAVFGNGYNNTDNTQGDPAANVSTSGNAVLYIVDIQTGAPIGTGKIDTQFGASRDPLGQSRPNGLGTPVLVDLDNDGVVEYAYAGDLFGNLWKFDLTSATATNWDVAYKVGGIPVPLFTAKDSLGRAQPITEKPAVDFGPNGVGMLLTFGTGKFLEPNDRDISLLKPQSFYGIYDRNTGIAATDVVTTRTSLVQQTIQAEQPVTVAGVTSNVRVTSKNVVDPIAKSGWYLDLIAPSGFQGEMSISDSIIRNGRVIFTTLIPDTDLCGYGGRSWLMEMDATTGARLDFSPLDLNNDNKFTDADYVTVNVNGADITVPISGVQSADGITPKPAVLTSSSDTDGTSEYLVLPNTNGDTDVKRSNPGPGFYDRQSWRQLR
jgi:type IV pilus assembly protein PilY1